MGNNNPNTSKGQHRETEVCVAAWIDLLGYGAMLEEVSFEPFDSKTRKAIERISTFHQLVADRSTKIFPSIVLNDGALMFKDLSPRSGDATFDFVYRAFKLFSQLNGVEKQNGYPGARMIIATGFRIRRQSNLKEHLKEGIAKHIIQRVESGEMKVKEAVIYSLMTRPVFDLLPELQANFAFAKAYIADAGGSRKGLAGPNCFIDLSLFDEELPNWLRLKGIVDWKDRGLKANFGIVDGIHKKLARENRFKGILNAFQVASRVSMDTNIVQKLRETRINRHTGRRI